MLQTPLNLRIIININATWIKLHLQNVCVTGDPKSLPSFERAMKINCLINWSLGVLQLPFSIFLSSD